MIDCEQEIDAYLRRLFPLTRSITGEGNRKTLRILKELIPLEILEFESGEAVYDWTIPPEWDIKEAWIKDSRGTKIIDIKVSNLHVVSYSIPVDAIMSLTELESHLHYLKELPDAIPYRTSYYDRDWGFCISYEQYQELFHEDEEYEVHIESELKDGSLSIGELVIGGQGKKEILLSCYICHPSMANDSLSGVITTALIARELLKVQDRLEHSYRVLFVPETIGAITYCSNNERVMQDIDNGLVITTCGGPGSFGYKCSWEENDHINLMIEEVFDENDLAFKRYPFDIRGSDERQYSSQGFRINCATISKDKYYEYDYYHTSLDDLDFVDSKHINASLDLYLQLIDKMDKNIIYKNLYPNCEVMLGKHGLYPKTGGAFLPDGRSTAVDIILWGLFYCDGKMGLYEISKLIGVDIALVYDELKRLERKAILARVG